MNFRKIITTISIFASVLILGALCTFADGSCPECDSENLVVFAEGEVLKVRCGDCKEELPYTIEITQDSVCRASDFAVEASEWEEAGMPEYVVIYEDDNDMYDSMPEEPGTYYVSLISLVDYENDMLYEEGHQTEYVEVTVGHEWNYSQEDYSLHAVCGVCGEKASVWLDTESIYEVNKYPEKNLSFDPVIENNWSCQLDIMPYKARYDGYEYVDSKNTTQYVTGEIKPENSGVYSVHLALVVEDGTTAGVELYSTKTQNFYVAKIVHHTGMNHYHTNAQIADLPKPSQIDGVYQVGTADELWWCLYNYASIDNMKISITDDIIVNPISVTDDGNVYIGSNYMYYWRGLGTVEVPFNGTIEGNGHTIYGLYVPKYTGPNPMHRLKTGDIAGFVAVGGNVTINNLTIENSYFNCRWSGAFIAVSTGNASLNNCNSVDNFIDGRFAGGLIAMARHTAEGQTLNITGCKNYSSFLGVAEVGGIVGYCDPDNPLYSGTISNCRNSGSVTTYDIHGGGIIGSIVLRDGCKFTVDRCVNTGEVIRAKYSGGIVGLFDTTKNSTNPTLSISGCCNTAKINQRYTTYGAILGGMYNEDMGIVYIKNCTYYNTDKITSIKSNEEKLKEHIENVTLEYYLRFDRGMGAQYRKVLSVIGEGNLAATIGKSGLIEINTPYDWWVRFAKYQVDNLPFGRITQADYDTYYNNYKNNPVFDAKLLTAEQIKNNYVCQTYGHDEENHYTNTVVAGCETYGSSQLVCHTCKTVLDTKQVKPHGHHYEWEDSGFCCSFCGQPKPGMTGSLFSDGINVVLVIAVPSVLLLGGGAYIIYKKRKKSKA